MANDPRFEVYPQKQRFFGGKIEHPKHGIVEAEDRTSPTGEFGWRFRAANGQITAIGGEGFTRRQDAERAVKHFLADVGANYEDTYVTPPIIDVDE
jgi:hypothetical protein